MKDQQFQFGITLDNGQLEVPTQRPLANQSNLQKKQPINLSSYNNTQESEDSLVPARDYTLSRANHPKVCLATVFFKCAAFFTYFFLGYFISNVLTFIFTVILSALDFWVVKNISGRLLVGLRWRSDYDEKGNQIWKYQTQNQNYRINKVDKSFFWTSLILGTLVWAFLLFINILQFDFYWALLLGINFSMCATNLYGYYLCRGEHKKKITQIKEQIGKAGLMHLAGKII